MYRIAPPASETCQARRGRLNIFQRLIRQWDRLHPYNAVQAAKIRGTFDEGLLRKTWRDSLRALGLGTVHVDGGRFHFDPTAPEADCELEIRPPGSDLSAWISDQLNEPFDATGDMPFRPFVIQQPGHFWMGVAYQHWVADSWSIRMLMEEWFVRQFDPARARSAPPPLSRPNWWAPPALEDGIGKLLWPAFRWANQLRRARRIENPDIFNDLSSRFIQIEAPTGLIDQLRDTARHCRATVNDFFLRAVAEAAHRHVPAPPMYRRQDLVLGTAVDLRRDRFLHTDKQFDLLLGFTGIACKPPDLGNPDALLKAIARQTRMQKRKHAGDSSWLAMAAALHIGRRRDPAQLLEFYRKRVSLAGGVSNVNLNNLWPSRYHPDPLQQFIRVAPTGPMMPLVVSTTTLGSDLALGLTYRTSILDNPAATGVLNVILEHLRESARLHGSA